MYHDLYCCASGLKFSHEVFSLVTNESCVSMVARHVETSRHLSVRVRLYQNRFLRLNNLEFLEDTTS